MNSVAVCRKLAVIVVIPFSGLGGLVAASAAPAGSAGRCAGTVYVANFGDGTVSVITTATGAVSVPIAVGSPVGMAICSEPSTQ